MKNLAIHQKPFQKREKNLYPHSGGYTLIEIMVVVVIIGILAALIVPNILNRPDQARAVAAKNDIRAIDSALRLYRLDNTRYPDQSKGLAALVSRPDGVSDWREGGYMSRLPKDPWGNPYRYRNPGTKNPSDFDVYSFGSDGQEGGTGVKKDIGNWDNSVE